MTRNPRQFATAAIVCFSYSVFTLLLVHAFRQDYAWRSHMISDYAVGRYGWVMQTWFVATGCGVLALLLGLIRIGPSSGIARIGTTLLGVACVGLVVSAIFSTDLPGAPPTRSGAVHDIGFLVNVGSLVLATGLLSFSFGGDWRWRSFRFVALLLTSLIVIALVLQFLTLHRGMPYGYTNRVFVAVLFAWFFATSIRLRAVERESAKGA